MEDWVFWSPIILLAVLLIWWLLRDETPKDFPKDWKKKLHKDNLYRVIEEISRHYGEAKFDDILSHPKVLGTAYGKRKSGSRFSLQVHQEFLRSVNQLILGGKIKESGRSTKPKKADDVVTGVYRPAGWSSPQTRKKWRVHLAPLGEIFYILTSPGGVIF